MRVDCGTKKPHVGQFTRSMMYRSRKRSSDRPCVSSSNYGVRPLVRTCLLTIAVAPVTITVPGFAALMSDVDFAGDPRSFQSVENTDRIACILS